MQGYQQIIPDCDKVSSQNVDDGLENATENMSYSVPLTSEAKKRMYRFLEDTWEDMNSSIEAKKALLIVRSQVASQNSKTDQMTYNARCTKKLSFLSALPAQLKEKTNVADNVCQVLELKEPGLPLNIITPERKCCVCSKEAELTGSPLTALTNTTKIQFHQKLSKVIGAELDLVVAEDGVICSGCCRLLNYLDRIEVEHKLITKSVVDFMRRTSGLGSLRDDRRMPEAVLTSTDDHTKKSR